MSRLPVSRAAAVALLAAALGGCALISLERLTVTVWPRDANAVLPLGSSPWIRFPSAPDQASVQRLFTLSAPTGSVAGDFRWATGNWMYFDPAPPLSPGVRYVLQFRGRVTLTDGGSFDANEEVPFYILHAGGGPLLQSVSPANGADAGTATPLVLGFSAAMDPDSFAREFTLQPSAETIAAWDVTGRRVTLTPRDSWSTLTTYTWTVTKDLAAPDGTPTGTEYTGRFRIQLDAAAPSVISVLPGLRSTFASTGTLLADDVLLIAFSEDVTDDSLMSAFTISPTTKGTLFRVASGPPAVFAFVPDSQWVMDQSYTLRIGTGLADLSGNKLSTAYETSFTPAIPLQVVSSIQASGNTWTVFNTLDAKPLTVDVDGNVTLSVTFAEPFTLDAEVRLASGILFDAYFPSSVTAPSLLSVSWSGGTVLTLTYAGMTRSTPTTDDYYKLTIPGGAPASDNGSGSFLKDDVWLYFLTAQ
jgi:hypothetical protein